MTTEKQKRSSILVLGMLQKRLTVDVGTERWIECQQSELRQWHFLNQDSNSLLQCSHLLENRFWGCFSQLTVLDTLLTIPLSRLTHSSIILCAGDTVMSKLVKILASSNFHFTLTSHPRSKSFFFLSFKIHSPSPPFLEKPDDKYFTRMLKHFLCQGLHNDE